jgi:LuxR family maltose regulon positive regulatory protein
MTIDAPTGADEAAHGDLRRPLTPRELQVLGFLPTNLSLPEIAEELRLSRQTVKAMVISIYRKIGVSRDEAVRSARARGLI